MPDPAVPKAITIPQGRTELRQFLLDLPQPQFEAVLHDLNPPKGNVPPSSAAQSDRVSALMAWVESPSVGPGIDTLRGSLEQVLNQLRYHGLPDQRPASSRSDRSEKTLLNAVWTEVEDRLHQSLHNAILIRLAMAEQRSQVSRPWDSQLRTADQATKTLAPGTPIAAVFDRRDVGGKLLILGSPGAGKTTTMLDLAATLIQRANDDPEEPIPVMASLSSWQNTRQSLTDWLLSELNLKYGVSQKLGKTWLTEKKLLPLFDGLDELPPQRQEPVVEAINAWLRSDEGAPRLLVCSRLEEYELYAAKLELNGAICLNLLTDGQLQDYLASLSMPQLWNTLQQDKDLLELVRTPLLLSVSILANEAIAPATWEKLQTPQEKLNYLLDTYIWKRLHESAVAIPYLSKKQPKVQQTRRWLSWLARQMRARSEDEFLIERMQPSLLQKGKEKWLYKCFPGLFLGAIIGLFTGFYTELALGFLSGIAMAIFYALFESDEPINTVEVFEFSFQKLTTFKKFLIRWVWLTSGLFMGLIFGLYSGISNGIFKGLISGLFLGIALGLASSLVYGSIQVFKEDISASVKPNQGIFLSLKNTVVFLVACLPVLILLNALASLVFMAHLDEYLSDRIIAATSLLVVWASVATSGMACIQHFALRFSLYTAGWIPWNYAHFLNYCTELLLLQRVGGRYRFIHRLVQERFAAMPLERAKS